MRSLPQPGTRAAHFPSSRASLRAARCARLATATASVLRLALAAAVLVFALFAHGPAAALEASSGAPEKIKAEYTKVADEVLCYCGCARQTVHECTCSVAMELRADWEGRLASGETPETLIAGYIAEHGEQSRNAPPRRGLNLLAWFGPGIAITLAGSATIVVIAVWAARGRRAREAAAAGAAMEAPAGDAEVRERLERELGKFDP